MVKPTDDHLLDCIFFSISIDHFSTDLSAPLRHANGQIDVPEGDDGNNQGVVSIESDEEIGNGNGQINEHGHH